MGSTCWPQGKEQLSRDGSFHSPPSSDLPLGEAQHPVTGYLLQGHFWDAWCISYWIPWGTSQACCHYPLTLAQRGLISISVLSQMQAAEDTGNQMAITKFSLQEVVLSLLTHAEFHPGILGSLTNPVSHPLMKIWRFYILMSKSWIFFLCFYWVQ